MDVGKMFSFFRKTRIVLMSYMSGKVIPIEEVEDEVFSSKALGKGIAIEPQNGIITAPCDGEISVLMEESCHAIGLTLENGAILLIHEGIDTVGMKGKGFHYLVKEGQKVKAGDKLLQFDRDEIKKQGYKTTCILVVANSDDFPELKFYTGMNAIQDKTVIAEF